eukprot:PLAT2025.1.p1 GENE.PLAT2025.1~~PLAT2025.1.p1  ORF type:complete len:508 (+),score=246.59 PLAT2025.1:20-1543(+)
MAALDRKMQDTLDDLRATFATGVTRDLAWRKRQLAACLNMVQNHEEEWMAALAADLRKPAFEAGVTETIYVAAEIRETIAKLDEWAAREEVASPLALLPGSSFIQREPYGVVLCIGPFNYPMSLTVQPMMGALAAGNCVVVKPSELTPHVSDLLERLVGKYLDPTAVRVVQGEIPETTALLKLPWDYIFFTGSVFVGKIVARAAAEHLTPTTLELGGKSPVVFDSSVKSMRMAVKRVLWGKFINTGQSCIAPDYVLVARERHDEFVELAVDILKSFFGDDPQASDSLGRIVSERHVRRLSGMLDAVREEEGARIVCGGTVDMADKYIAPTLVTGVTKSSALMEDEIFGPILPIMAIDSIDEAIELINGGPKPLALYVFSDSKAVQDRVLARTSSGGVTLNDTMSHFSNGALPFGGVGTAGMGAYHGRHTFNTFSHARGVVAAGTIPALDAAQKYPPYNTGNLKILRFALSSTMNTRKLATFARCLLGLIALGLLAKFRRELHSLLFG